MKYSEKTLETLKNSYSSRLDGELENEVFEEIENLESQNLLISPTNLLSIYVNFAMPKTHKLRMEKNREIVKMLIKHNLCSFQDCDGNTVLISRITKSGIQSISNYTL